MKITLQQLKDANACMAQTSKFARFFGQEIEITPDLCEALATQFEWVWAADAFLDAFTFEEFATRRDEAHTILHNKLSTLEQQRTESVIAFGIYTEERRIAFMRYHQALANAFATLYNRPKAVVHDSATFRAQHPEA